MTRLELKKVSIALGGLGVALAAFKMFLLTGNRSWIGLSSLVAYFTTFVMFVDMIESPIITLMFGLLGGTFTCLYAYAYNLTHHTVWGVVAIVFAAWTAIAVIGIAHPNSGRRW